VVCCWAPCPLVVATVPTFVIVPLTRAPVGSATSTPAPTWASVCLRASRFRVTEWSGDVPLITSWPGCTDAPSDGLTCATRSAPAPPRGGAGGAPGSPPPRRAHPGRAPPALPRRDVRLRVAAVGGQPGPVAERDEVVLELLHVVADDAGGELAGDRDRAVQQRDRPAPGGVPRLGGAPRPGRPRG